MNIPHKFLINNYLSEKKKKFYEKLSIRYSKIITEFVKKKANIDNFQMKVMNWLFNQDEETKMILCSVENKKFTNTIYEAFNYYNISDNITFKITDNDSDNDKYKLEYNDFNYNKYFNKSKYNEINNMKKKNNIYNKFFNIPNKFLNELFFYQCESPINDYENYSSYFTLSPKFLKNDQIFKNQCGEITNHQFLKSPIMTKRDPKNKSNLLFALPNWIEEKNENNKKINDNYPYDTDENIYLNNNSYFTLDQYILALIEQVLSIRYILYIEKQNIQEIIESTYLYDLFDKKHLILSYMDNIKIETNMYYKYFKIDDVNANIFLSQDIEKFIKDKNNSIKKTDNALEDNDYSNNENDSAFMNIENIFESMVNKYKDNKTELNKEIINMCLFFHIQKLFTLDDFFFREIFDNFYTEYLNQIYHDLIKDKEEKPKKRRKKKKKNNNTNLDDIQNNKDNIINEDNNNYKDEIFNFVKKLILDNLEEKINKINNSNIIIKNKKEKNNKKEKEFFLYDTVIKKEKKKMNHKSKNKNNKNNNDDNEKNNIIEDNILNNEFLENSNNSNINKSISTNNSINNFDIIKNNNIFQNKMNTSYENKLNDDIDNFYKDMESLLIIIRKIKNEIQNHFELIIKNIYESNSKLEIYGSSLYQLDIESSDLDLGITTKSNLSLDSLVKYLYNNNYNNQYINLNYIYTASIPIIKLELDYLKLDNDKINDYYKSLINNNYYKICIKNNIYKDFNIIKVDISLKSINHKQINFIKKGINDFPQIKPLIKIIKKLLFFKDMNNSYKGGMSSYCLFLIIYSYLKISPNYDANNNNYSSLLMGFLYYYINCIDFKYTIINPSLDNPFVIYDCIIETIPTIIDPVTMKNAGKIIFKIIDVVNFLKEIYNDILLIIKDNKNNINIIYKLFSKYQEDQD